MKIFFQVMLNVVLKVVKNDICTSADVKANVKQ